MKRLLLITAASLAMVAAIAFLADYLALRLGSGAKFDSIEVRRLYAVKLKGNKTNYMYDPPSPAACVNSVFPHYGDTPCWYLRRHTTVQVNLDSGAFGAWIDTP